TRDGKTLESRALVFGGRGPALFFTDNQTGADVVECQARLAVLDFERLEQGPGYLQLFLPAVSAECPERKAQAHIVFVSRVNIVTLRERNGIDDDRHAGMRNGERLGLSLA